MRRSLRYRALARPLASLGLASGFLILPATTIGPQDLAQQLAKASGADLTWRRHVASQIHPSMRMASFALPQPANKATAPSERVMAMLTPPDMNPARVPERIGRPTSLSGLQRGPVYPTVNREAKGDLMVARAKLPAEQARPVNATPSDLFAPSFTLRGRQSFLLKPWNEAIDDDVPAAPRRLKVAAVSTSSIITDMPAEALLGMPTRLLPGLESDDVVIERFSERDSSVEPAGIFIEGDSPIASAGGGFGAPPIPVDHDLTQVHASPEFVPGFDPILNSLSADRRGDKPDPVLARLLGTPQMPPFAFKTVPLPGTLSSTMRAAITHPAMVLNLEGKALEKATKCLADAVYWEARSESETGQVAVAQVVLNRATSGFYPNDVCGVVYQNSHRYLACQFTFACEGRRNLIPTEAASWEQAQRVAREMMEGKLWLAKVANATHYHATYVRPWWARSMNKHDHIGLHVFYRPKAWSS